MENESIANHWSKSVFHQYRTPILVSIAVHLVLVIVLWFWWRPAMDPAANQELATSNQSGASSRRKTDSADKTQAALDDADLGLANLDVDVPPEQIQSSIQSQIVQVDALSDAQKLKTLDKKLSRLEQVSDQESVEQVAGAVAKSLGIDQSQYADKPVKTEGDFDHSTAQIKAVTRNHDDSGDWKYIATMVDAQGHQLETPLSQSEGASVYDTFEKMKQYPMAESLYQKIIMPMLQKTIEAKAQR